MKITSIEKLNKRILSELGFEIENFHRLYPGYWQRSAGAWSWTSNIKDCAAIDIGSTYSVGDLLKCKKLEIFKSGRGYGTELLPTND